jgi:hypothetical protein
MRVEESEKKAVSDDEKNPDASVREISNENKTKLSII